MSATDTIFAVASGAGRAAVAVMRISGPDTGRIVDALCRRPSPRVATLRTLRGAEGLVLDRALLLWLPGPGSYTGEDSAELHLHGGPAVLAGVAEALAASGARPAEPGEFTRRAFLNGRMDLVEAEGVADLVEAETVAQRDQALRQMRGELGALYHGWTARLIALLARQEAMIDFPDEDLPAEIDAAVSAEIAALEGEVRAHLADSHRGERLRDGLVFAVVGPPNTGKSSLVNILADRAVSIVAPSSGTTRDVIEVRIVLAGVPITLLDTAGLRNTSDPVEAEGVHRARQRARDADLVILVDDPTAPEGEAVAADRLLRVGTKCDLAAAPRAVDVRTSAINGTGIDTLRALLAEHARALTQASGPPPLTRARHRAALQEVAVRLAAARAAPLAELRGEDLRIAVRGIGRITGAVGVEDILDSVFAQFCIGK